MNKIKMPTSDPAQLERTFLEGWNTCGSFGVLSRINRIDRI